MRYEFLYAGAAFMFAVFAVVMANGAVNAFTDGRTLVAVLVGIVAVADVVLAVYYAMQSMRQIP